MQGPSVFPAVRLSVSRGGANRNHWSLGSHVRPVNTIGKYYKAYQELGHCILSSGFMGQSSVFQLQTWYLYPRCIMTRPYIACHKFGLDLVFKGTTIFTFETFEGGTNCHLWVGKIFILVVDTSIDEPLSIQQPDQFDLCQAHSSKRPFQWKSTGFHINRCIVLRPLGLGIAYQNCEHLGWILLGIPRTRLVHPHFWILYESIFPS